MNKSSRSPGDKPRRKGKVRGKKQSQITKSKDWEFKPKLYNEAIVLHSILDIYDESYYRIIVNDIRNLVTSLIRNHGYNDGPKRYNIIKNYTVELIEFREPSNPGWLATSEKNRIPSKLGISAIKLIVDYFGCTEPSLRAKYYQAIITILNIPRIVEGLVDADLESVTNKAIPIEDDLLKQFTTYVDEKLDAFAYEPKKVNFSSYKINFKKNGPNEVPKLESATNEAISLLSNKELHYPFRNLCNELDSLHLYSYMSQLSAQVAATHDISSDPNSINKAKTPKEFTLRKLVTIPDSGMKTRIVAIVDFWTQLALEPIRDHVQYVIQKLYSNTDFRMSQNSGVAAMVDFQKRCLTEETLNSETLNIEKLRFYDISSWTDRFHRDLQKVVMRKLFGSTLAQAWAQLVVHCSWQVGTSGRIIKYGQGQGMGTNGSFDVATLTDHLYINFMYDVKYNKQGYSNLGCYGKVGDDLWIYDPEDMYPEMCKKINLPINFSKSKEFCKIGSIAEFCSRTFINGEDCSRISPRIISRSTNFRYLPLLLSYCCSRGIQLKRSSFKFLDNITQKDKESYFDKLQPWIISVFTVSSENFSHLTLDYLEAGNWITDRTKSIISDQATLYKIQSARCIKQIAELYSDIEVLTSETIEAEGNLSMEDMFILSQGKDDRFDIESPTGAFALKWFKTDKVLNPKQIFVLGRYLTQNHLITDKFYDIYQLNPSDPEYIYRAKDILEEISTRSMYDQGNVNYDTAGYVSAQFAIVNTLSSFDDEFKTLSLSQSELDTFNRLTGESVQESRISDMFEVIKTVEDTSS